MGYTVVPDLTTSSLSISNAATGNPNLTMSQLAGGFTWSEEFPLYLEGGFAYSLYDPVFVFSNGQESLEVPLKWSSVMLTGGIGWSFPVVEHLSIRPIVNLAYGRVDSELRLNPRQRERALYTELNLEVHSRLDAVGYGGSLMVDYESHQAARDIDLEWRFSYVTLTNTSHTGNFAKGSSDAVSTSTFARWRAPTGMRWLDGSLRYVLEAAHTAFLGDRVDAIGFDALSSVGGGFEVKRSDDHTITHARLVARYRLGENVEGIALGISVGF